MDCPETAFSDRNTSAKSWGRESGGRGRESGSTQTDSRPRLGVLISGRGSNLQSIADAIADRTLDATIAIVVSNRADAPGLARARAAGIEAVHLNPRAYQDRDAFDDALVDLLRARDVGLVCLAGFMRRVGPPLLDAFPNRILNVHPSLLPAFPGLDAQRQALEYGVRMTGATVHLVTAELDGGPVVRQAAVPVLDDDTVETLSARILVEEHRIYPEAIGIVLGGTWRLEGRRFVVGP
jgi:phosphoribosylglycinamide formyltransferase-1